MQQTQTFKSGVWKTIQALLGYSPFVYASIYMILGNLTKNNPSFNNQANLESEWSVFVVCAGFVLLFAIGFFNFFYISVEIRSNGIKLRRSGLTYAYLRYARCDVRLTQTKFSFFFVPRVRYQIECLNETIGPDKKRNRTFICYYFSEESFKSLSKEVERTKKIWLEGQA